MARLTASRCFGPRLIANSASLLAAFAASDRAMMVAYSSEPTFCIYSCFLAGVLQPSYGCKLPMAS